MTFLNSVLMLGVSAAIIAGIMCGAYTAPMKYMGRWSWENVWAVFMLVSCVLMPVAMVAITAPQVLEILRAVPAHVVVVACAAGFAWGFGAIMFGQGVSAIGVSMANTLVLAISATIGSLLPMALLAPEKMAQLQGKAVLGGSVVGLVGIACCGYAGLLREKHQQQEKQRLRGKMVGTARPIAVGIMLCAGAGLLSAVLNIGFSLAQPIMAATVHFGGSQFAGSNIIVMLLLCSGSIPNLGFCAYLFVKNGSWGKFKLEDCTHLYALAILMGLMWGGEMFLYGYASPKIGKLGPAIGWPLKLIAGLITANAIGFMTGEWKLTRAKARIWMLSGVAVLWLAIVLLGWSSTLSGL